MVFEVSDQLPQYLLVVPHGLGVVQEDPLLREAAASAQHLGEGHRSVQRAPAIAKSALIYVSGSASM